MKISSIPAMIRLLEDALSMAREIADHRAIDNDEEELIPLKAAADLFGVSDRTMQRHCEAGAGVKGANGRWRVYVGRILLPRKDRVRG